MATNALPSGRSDQKCLNSDSVSIVPPDFVETRNRAWSRSMAVSTPRTAPASVESSTCRLGQPPCSPNERRMTSGASDEPPMPSSTTSVTPSSRTPSAKACRSSSSSRICSATVSHPRRLATSGWPAGPQSVSSLRQMRRATSSCAACLTRCATRGSTSSSGSEASIDGGRCVTIASRLAPMPSSSFSIGSTNLSTPSRRSWSVTSTMSMPASASAFRTGAGSSRAVAPRISAWSPVASRVAIGMVLTVLGPTSSSTYITSR